MASLYFIGYFFPLYVSLYDEGSKGKMAGKIALITSWSLIGLGAIAFAQRVNRIIKATDIMIFSGYSFYYFLHGQNGSLEALKSLEE